jgi:hypothetical protein
VGKEESKERALCGVEADPGAILFNKEFAPELSADYLRYNLPRLHSDPSFLQISAVTMAHKSKYKLVVVLKYRFFLPILGQLWK